MKWYNLTFLVFLVSILSIYTADSERIFQYKDKDGIIHFVDTPDKIPAEYKNQAEQRETLEKETPIVNYEELIQKETSGGDSSEDVSEISTDEKKAEELKAWEESKQKIESELASAKSNIDDAEAFRARTINSYSRENYTNSDRDAAAKKLEIAKQEYERIKKKYDEFKDEAKTKAPYDWWRANFY